MYGESTYGDAPQQDHCAPTEDCPLFNVAQASYSLGDFTPALLTDSGSSPGTVSSVHAVGPFVAVLFVDSNGPSVYLFRSFRVGGVLHRMVQWSAGGSNLGGPAVGASCDDVALSAESVIVQELHDIHLAYVGRDRRQRDVFVIFFSTKNGGIYLVQRVLCAVGFDFHRTQTEHVGALEERGELFPQCVCVVSPQWRGEKGRISASEGQMQFRQRSFPSDSSRDIHSFAAPLSTSFLGSCENSSERGCPRGLYVLLCSANNADPDVSRVVVTLAVLDVDRKAERTYRNCVAECPHRGVPLCQKDLFVWEELGHVTRIQSQCLTHILPRGETAIIKGPFPTGKHAFLLSGTFRCAILLVTLSVAAPEEKITEENGLMCKLLLPKQIQLTVSLRCIGTQKSQARPLNDVVLLPRFCGPSDRLAHEVEGDAGSTLGAIPSPRLVCSRAKNRLWLADHSGCVHSTVRLQVSQLPAAAGNWETGRLGVITEDHLVSWNSNLKPSRARQGIQSADAGPDGSLCIAVLSLHAMCVQQWVSFRSVSANPFQKESASNWTPVRLFEGFWDTSAGQLYVVVQCQRAESPSYSELSGRMKKEVFTVCPQNGANRIFLYQIAFKTPSQVPVAAAAEHALSLLKSCILRFTEPVEKTRELTLYEADVVLELWTALFWAALYVRDVGSILELRNSMQHFWNLKWIAVLLKSVLAIPQRVCDVFEDLAVARTYAMRLKLTSNLTNEFPSKGPLHWRYHSYYPSAVQRQGTSVTALRKSDLRNEMKEAVPGRVLQSVGMWTLWWDTLHILNPSTREKYLKRDKNDLPLQREADSCYTLKNAERPTARPFACHTSDSALRNKERTKPRIYMANDAMSFPSVAMLSLDVFRAVSGLSGLSLKMQSTFPGRALNANGALYINDPACTYYRRWGSTHIFNNTSVDGPNHSTGQPGIVGPAGMLLLPVFPPTTDKMESSSFEDRGLLWDQEIFFGDSVAVVSTILPVGRTRYKELSDRHTRRIEEKVEQCSFIERFSERAAVWRSRREPRRLSARSSNVPACDQRKRAHSFSHSSALRKKAPPSVRSRSFSKDAFGKTFSPTPVHPLTHRSNQWIKKWTHQIARRAGPIYTWDTESKIAFVCYVIARASRIYTLWNSSNSRKPALRLVSRTYRYREQKISLFPRLEAADLTSETTESAFPMHFLPPVLTPLSQFSSLHTSLLRREEQEKKMQCCYGGSTNRLSGDEKHGGTTARNCKATAHQSRRRTLHRPKKNGIRFCAAREKSLGWTSVRMFTAVLQQLWESHVPTAFWLDHVVALTPEGHDRVKHTVESVDLQFLDTNVLYPFYADRHVDLRSAVEQYHSAASFSRARDFARLLRRLLHEAQNDALLKLHVNVVALKAVLTGVQCVLQIGDGYHFSRYLRVKDVLTSPATPSRPIELSKRSSEELLEPLNFFQNEKGQKKKVYYSCSPIAHPAVEMYGRTTYASDDLSCLWCGKVLVAESLSSRSEGHLELEGVDIPSARELVQKPVY